MAGEKIIYTMVRVSKIVPPNRTILRDISLSYFYGAKIGVVGPNGSGKSTLLRIMAGVDKDFQGEAKLSPGYTLGYLPQEPILDPEKTAIEIVREGAAEVDALLRRFEEISQKFAEPLSPEEMEKLLAEQAQLQEAIDAVDGWNIDNYILQAMEALRCPPPDAPVKVLSGGEKRRLALARLLIQEPDILLLDEPTNHLDAEAVAWLEAHLAQYQVRSLRLLTIAISWKRWPSGFWSWIMGMGCPGRATTPLGFGRRRPNSKKRTRLPSGAGPFNGSWNGFRCRPATEKLSAKPGSPPTNATSVKTKKSLLRRPLP